MRLKFKRKRGKRPETYAQAEALDGEVDGDKETAPTAGKPTVGRDDAGRWVSLKQARM
jgi:hypothetical protein